MVIGSGPNGLAAALTLARAGLSVDVYEGAATPGGGTRSADLTLPGFRHDVCSAVHPLLRASPFFRGVELEARGVRLLTPPIAFAHPLDGGRSAAVIGSVDETSRAFGIDGARYRRTFNPLARDAEQILPTILAPLRSVPTHPIAMARFGLAGLMPASLLARRFETTEARALLAGAAAHAVRPLDAPLTGSFALLFTMIAHALGWPVVEGGSERITDALVRELESHGGSVITGTWINDLEEGPRARATLADVSARRFADLGRKGLPPRYAAALRRFRYGPGVFKVDWALDGPVPWEAPPCREAGTVHVGGTFEEVAQSEADVNAGRHPERPFCVVAQPSVVDATRAPAGRHTLWAYCHVPAGSTVDMTERIESQIERFAPGFRELVLARATSNAVEIERDNPNDIGGDITGGVATLRQTIFRPTVSWNPYRTPIRGLYLCSASTPPGGGVHGMCGYGAALTALADLGVRHLKGDLAR